MDVSKLFDKAKAAVERRNYDYAIELFQQLLTLDPNNVEAREILRSTEMRRIQEQGGSPAMAYLKGAGALMGILLGRISKNYEKTMVACEKFLVHNPSDGFVMTALGDAAIGAGFTDTAILAFENIRKNKPEDIGALKKLAELHQTKQEFKKAQAYYDQVLKIKPHDKDASRWSKQLAAQISMDTGGWNTAGTYKDVVKDKDEAGKMEMEHHIARTEDEIRQAIVRVDERIARRPDDLKLFIEKGDYLRRLHQYDQAVAVFRSVLEKDKAHFTAMARIGDVALEKLDNAIRDLRVKLKADPSDAAIKAQLKKTQIRKIAQAVQEFQKRVQHHPTDLELRYQLGFWLYSGGKCKEAAGEFQQAIRDPKRRSKAQQYLGLCFLRLGRLPLAAEQLEKSLSSYAIMNEDAKEVAYNLGDVYSRIADAATGQEGRKNALTKAEETFKKVFEVDLNYKDVSERMEKIATMLGSL